MKPNLPETNSQNRPLKIRQKKTWRVLELPKLGKFPPCSVAKVLVFREGTIQHLCDGKSGSSSMDGMIGLLFVDKYLFTVKETWQWKIRILKKVLK